MIDLKTSRAFLTVDLDKLERNYKKMRAIIPSNCEIIAVLKADASNMGSIVLAKKLQSLAVKNFAVATLQEAIDLREGGIDGEILILGYVDKDLISYIHQYDLTITIVDLRHAEEINQSKTKTKVHVKIDTGMGRLGTNVEDFDTIKKILKKENIDIKGIYTHLSSSDEQTEEARLYSNNQLKKFHDLCDHLKKEHIVYGSTHALSSYAVWNNYEIKEDFVRLGYSLFGIYSDHEKTVKNISLEPIASLKARITMIKTVKENTFLSYNRTYRTTKPATIATVGIGYADGVPRGISNKNVMVKIKDQMAPIIGKICMDQMLIDISELHNIKVGDIVTIFDDNLTDLAEKGNTISNEVLCQIGKRVERIYIDKNHTI